MCITYRRVAPATTTIRRWHQAFMSTGAVIPVMKKKGMKASRAPENVTRIEEYFDKANEDQHEKLHNDILKNFIIFMQDGESPHWILKVKLA